MTTIRKHQNAIWKIRDEQGNWHTDQVGISQVIAREFTKRIKSDNLINLEQAIPLSKDITESNNDRLTMDVSSKEILEAMKQINPPKAPGPNGIQAIFYQNC